MSSVSPGNPADRLAPEVGWVCGWLWRGLGGGWHFRQAQQAFSWGTRQMWSPLVSGDALILSLLGRERGTSAAVGFFNFFFLLKGRRPCPGAPFGNVSSAARRIAWLEPLLFGS